MRPAPARQYQALVTSGLRLRGSLEHQRQAACACGAAAVYQILLLMLLLVLPPLADEYVSASLFNPVSNARNC